MPWQSFNPATLTQWRQIRGIRAGQLAEFAGVSRQMFLRYQKAGEMPQGRLEAVAEGLGVSVAKLQADPLLPLASASIELLFHYRCGVESCGQWWSVADIPPGKAMVCPHCGAEQLVPEVRDGRGGVVGDVVEVGVAAQ